MLAMNRCPLQKPGCLGSTVDAVCSSCLAASGGSKLEWGVRHDRRRAAPVTCSDSQPKPQKFARHDEGATGKSGATGSDDGLPTVAPRKQRCGEMSRLNRQEKRLHLQKPARLHIVAQVAAIRAGGLFLSADAVKAWQEHCNIIERDMSKLRAAAKPGAASGQQPSSSSSQEKPAVEGCSGEQLRSQQHLNSLEGKEKAKVHKTAVEAFRWAKVKQEIGEASESSSYEEIEQYIELQLSSSRVLPDLIEEEDFEYGTHDV
jgi:hypothetical protein